MKLRLKKIIGALALAFVFGVGVWVLSGYRSSDHAEMQPKPSLPGEADSTGSPRGENATGMPLAIPHGFSIEVFAKDLPGARVMAFDPFGNLWVSQTSQGTISLVEVQEGKAVRHGPVLRGLENPHGLAFDPKFPSSLYFAEEDKISRVAVYSDGKPEQIVDLPSGGGHFTRTISFGPADSTSPPQAGPTSSPHDDRLYVSIGSSCNVCVERDSRRAKIFSMNRDGSDFREFARGLRNTVFFTWSEVDGRMWGTDMGRDLIGEDFPPDEINIIEANKNYGWPYCYGKNIQDQTFSRSADGLICNEKTGGQEQPSHIDIPAHSAPLGLAFVPESTAWPEEYWHDLFVAYHGSWNRDKPAGYKVVRMKLDANGNFLGAEDFIAGWLPENILARGPLAGEIALGRPVHIIIQPNGTMYISDDKAGVIYKVRFIGTSATQKEGLGEKSNLIRVFEPAPNIIAKTPLAVSGEARGYWFFEASFPVRVLDEDGTELGVGIAQAKSEWMTEEFVAFETVVEFKRPKGSRGAVVFEKDNPSGLAEHADALSIPVRFR